MGMGEPLLNISNVLKSISLINYSHGLNISQKRITVSTAGITKIIKKIADLKPKFNLAISLHSANNKKRSELMEINETNNLRNLLASVQAIFIILLKLSQLMSMYCLVALMTLKMTQKN